MLIQVEILSSSMTFSGTLKAQLEHLKKLGSAYLVKMLDFYSHLIIPKKTIRSSSEILILLTDSEQKTVLVSEPSLMQQWLKQMMSHNT